MEKDRLRSPVEDCEPIKMGSDIDMDKCEGGGKGEKVKEELKEEKRKFPQIFGEVDALTQKIKIIDSDQFRVFQNL